MERKDGSVRIRHDGVDLPAKVIPKYDSRIDHGAIVENKALGGALKYIQEKQKERDKIRLASRGLTLDEKKRLRDSRNKEAIQVR